MASLPDDLPPHHLEAAELVRRHLVVLRGGVLFLSPRDGAALVKWLDDGVPVARILYGLEIAAERRRRRSERAPLQLTHASRFLGRARTVAVEVAPLAADTDGRQGLLDWLDGVGRAPWVPRFAARFSALRASIAAMPEAAPRALAARTIGLLADFQAHCWEDLGDAGRAPYETAAVSGLGDLTALFAEDELSTLTEEHARGLFRAELVGLDAAAVLQVVGL